MYVHGNDMTADRKSYLSSMCPRILVGCSQKFTNFSSLLLITFFIAISGGMNKTKVATVSLKNGNKSQYVREREVMKEVGAE